MAHWIRRVLLASATILSVLAAPPAQAAEAKADDSGWFEPSAAAEPSPMAAAGSPATPASAPGAMGQPQPGGGTELPSLPPSPLLSDRNAEQPAPDPVDTDPRALSDFRPRLDPYGSWMQHPTYGSVWVPNPSTVGSNFAPYVSSGRWALDEDGNWVWMSDYPFGDVVFHYGRWVWVSNTGWAWVPGYRYAPAWVHWRVPTASYAYVGWAPMAPDYVWFNGYAVSFWYGVSTPWVFCPSAYVFHSGVHHYVVHDRGLVTRLAASTRRYAPASPRRAGSSDRSRFSSGPPLSAARVPERAVPTARIRAVPRLTSADRTLSRSVEPASPRRLAPFPSPRSEAVPSSRSRVPTEAWGDRRAPAPARQRAAAEAPERLRQVPAAEPRIRPLPAAEPRIRPSPAAEPRMRAEPRLRDLAPQQRVPMRDFPSGGPTPRLRRPQN